MDEAMHTDDQHASTRGSNAELVLHQAHGFNSDGAVSHLSTIDH